MESLDAIAENQFVSQVMEHVFETVTRKSWCRSPQAAGLGQVPNSQLKVMVRVPELPREEGTLEMPPVRRSR
jgi:hypothetical protein